MLDLWKSLSDDQIALVGCAAALTVAGTVMSLSYYIGRGRIASLGKKTMMPVLDSAQIKPTGSPAVAARRRRAAA